MTINLAIAIALSLLCIVACKIRSGDPDKQLGFINMQ